MLNPFSLIARGTGRNCPRRDKTEVARTANMEAAAAARAPDLLRHLDPPENCSTWGEGGLQAPRTAAGPTRMPRHLTVTATAMEDQRGTS